MTNIALEIQAAKDRELILSNPELGEVPDTLIAKQLGFSVAKIQRIRYEAGIEGFQSRTRRLEDHKPAHIPSWISPYLQRWRRTC
jgi:hypothetical protein